MWQSKFIVKDTINVFFNESVNSIELCLGDISELDERNKVDMLIISASKDGYGTPAGTVMHSLEKNLKLSVAELAKNKAVDKRSTHQCWWTPPLPQANIPYGRLLCYESGAGQCLATDCTTSIFACLKEIYGKTSFKVATSLLNTGNQGVDEVAMLEAIIKAAIGEMEQGLNMRQLMIFINVEVKDEAMAAEPKVKNFEGICAKFEEIKQKNIPI